MPNQTVSDSVPKINNDLAVGADMAFQRKWWRFEDFVWLVFGIVLLLDVIGLLGKGPLADAEAGAEANGLQVAYERIERYGTPSKLSINFLPSAIKDNHIELAVSDTLTKSLGNERIIPQPATSTLHANGFQYRFPATPGAHTVEFALEPAQIGSSVLTLQVTGKKELQLRIFVLP